MQRRIGRAAGGGHHHGGILERLAGGDVARTRFLGQELHHRLAGLERKVVTLQDHRRRAAGIRQRQADGLGDAGHGVGGELAAAGARAGAGDLLQQAQLAFGHFAGGILAHAFEQIDHGHVAAVESSRHDRAAIEEDADGTFRRSIAIIMPGSDLSQPASPTSAS